TTSTATTSRTSGASAKASAPVPVPESSARSSPAGERNTRSSSRSASRRRSSRSPSRAAVAANRSLSGSSVSSELLPHQLQRLLACRDRACRALLGDALERLAPLRPRGQAELVAVNERRGGLLGPRPLDRGGVLAGTAQRERLDRPRPRRAPETRD